MSMAKNQRTKRRRREKKDDKYISVMKSEHIKEQGNAIINRGLLQHAIGTGKPKIKKRNKGFVEKFKRLFKSKI